MSTLCSYFIWQGGSIVCTITGGRRYSSDLAPCVTVLTCTGDNNEIKKLMKLLPSNICATTTDKTTCISVDINEKESEADYTTEKIWVKCGKCFLLYTDKEALSNTCCPKCIDNNLWSTHVII